VSDRRTAPSASPRPGRLLRKGGVVAGSRGSLIRELVASSLLVAIVVGAVFVLLLNAIGDLREANGSARRAADILASSNRLEKLVIDLETGLRGYLVTREPRFLGPYRSARRAYTREAASLDMLVQVPVQRRRLDAIDRDVRDYLVDYSQPLIDRTRSGEAAPAETRRATGEGKRRVDVMRRRFADFSAAEEQIVARRRRRADNEVRQALDIAKGGAVGSLFLLLLLAAVLARGVARPIRQVSVAAQRVTEGDLTTQVEPTGPAEVAALGRSFNQMVSELSRAQRAQDEFFALVSHELRTPLTSIVGYTDVLKEELEEDPGPPLRSRAVDRIDRASRRLSRLVGDLLFVAEIEAGRLNLKLAGAVGLDEVARESVEGLRHRAEGRGQTLELDAAPVHVERADRDRLGQVVDNLLANAIKFTPEGGRVTVSVRPDGGDAVLTVADTGIGIPESEQDRLFQRFFRASSATEGHIEGVGLGLSIVQSIVVGHGGLVTVDSAPGDGAAFTVRIPRQGVTEDDPGEGRDT
jgi:signal transduction histidine kinase